MSGVRRQLQVLADGPAELPGLKVAFATADRETVNQHFGSAKSFMIFAVKPDEVRVLTVSEFEDPGRDASEDKLASKLELLQGCIAVYCRACGASAVRQLLASGIQPVKVHEGALIRELLRSLQRELKEGPSKWLAKAIQRHRDLPGMDGQRFDAMETDGWLD